MTTDLKRASLMPEKNIKKYAETHLYVFDDIDINFAPTQTPAYRKHVANCHLIKTFFNDCVDCLIHSIVFTGPTDNEKYFLAWWKAELAKYDKNILIIVYFNGEATGRGVAYTWKFVSKPRKVNAFKLFDITDRQKPDCLWILDCPFATRFDDIPRRPLRGHTEYTISGQVVPEVMNRDPFEHAEFTYQLTRFLASWVARPDSYFLKHNKRKTLPEILSRDEYLASNPLRLWERRTNRDDRRRVYRLCVEPLQVQLDGYITFERVRIQGAGKLLPDGSDADNDNSDDSSDDDSFDDNMCDMEDYHSIDGDDDPDIKVEESDNTPVQTIENGNIAWENNTEAMATSERLPNADPNNFVSCGDTGSAVNDLENNQLPAQEAGHIELTSSENLEYGVDEQDSYLTANTQHRHDNGDINGPSDTLFVT